MISFVLVAILSLALAQSSTTIVAFDPISNSTVSSVKFPIVLTFSENVTFGEGSIVLENSFGDVTNFFKNSTQVEIQGVDVTITLSDKFYYGTEYMVYFQDDAILDAEGKAVTLAKGEYVFYTAKKDNGPMFIGIGLGMVFMLIIIFAAYFILKCLVKRKEAKEAMKQQLPTTNNEANM